MQAAVSRLSTVIGLRDRHAPVTNRPARQDGFDTIAANAHRYN
jgi:hypothetical protein